MVEMAMLVRRILDRTYKLSGYLAAVFLALILVLVSMQMFARWGGEMMTGAPDYTGYCMAAASFLALPYALNNGSHIRVSLFLNGLGKYRKLGELWCWAIASYLGCFFAYYAIKSTYESYRFNDISQGQDAWPLWIPQIAMCIGVTLFAISLVDNLITTLLTGKDNISADSVDLQAE